MTRFVPVSHARHAGWHWRRFDSFAFVQDQPLVPIVLGEHEQLATTLPIVVARTEGAPWPVALTRLGPRCALVAPNGVWRGVHVPTLLRVHPFRGRHRTGRTELLIDEASDLVQPRLAGAETGVWEAVFDPAGQPVPTLSKLLDFFTRRAPAEARTRAAIDALVAAGGVTSTPPVTGLSLPDDILWPDAAALAGLGRVQIAQLHRAGAMSLAHAMLVARHHLPFLTRAEALGGQRTGGMAQGSPPADEALRSFLDGFSDARQHDEFNLTRPGISDDGQDDRSG